jgi:tyrosine-protein phosphatase SIW14
MPKPVRALLVSAIVLLVAGGPFLLYRAAYTHSKRLRPVVPGRFYRSGQLTADGFADAVRRFGIRTFVNAQNELPDPPITRSFLDSGTVPESELCRELGVRYVWIVPDLLPRDRIPEERPKALDDFLKLMDDESNYPVLLHCRAGLHRTGLLAAVYRMEYQGWSRQEALRELNAHGFGEFACSSANDYVMQYVLSYRPRHRPAADSRKPIAE